MPGRGGMGAEATGAVIMAATGASGMGAMAANGMGATGGEALGWGSASASDRSGGLIGGHTGVDTGDLMPMATPMPIPMSTRPLSPCHPPKSMCNPQRRSLPSLLHQHTGITATMHGGITPTCSNVQGDGGQSPLRRHKPEARGPRARQPARVASVRRCDRGLDTSSVGVNGGPGWGVWREFWKVRLSASRLVQSKG
jgi:hypothetical protein